MTNPNRVPPGVPEAGQYATGSLTEAPASVNLDERTSLHEMSYSDLNAHVARYAAPGLDRSGRMCLAADLSEAGSAERAGELLELYRRRGDAATVAAGPQDAVGASYDLHDHPGMWSPGERRAIMDATLDGMDAETAEHYRARLNELGEYIDADDGIMGEEDPGLDDAPQDEELTERLRYVYDVEMGKAQFTAATHRQRRRTLD